LQIEAKTLIINWGFGVLGFWGSALTSPYPWLMIRGWQRVRQGRWQDREPKGPLGNLNNNDETWAGNNFDYLLNLL